MEEVEEVAVLEDEGQGLDRGQPRRRRPPRRDDGGGEGGPDVEEKESGREHSPRVPRPGVLSRVRENQSQYLRFLPTADGDHLFSGA